MKYSIDGFNDSNVVKNILVGDNVILVKYLDKTEDTFENTEANNSNICAKMNEQGKAYVDCADVNLKKVNLKRILTMVGTIILVVGESVIVKKNDLAQNLYLILGSATLLAGSVEQLRLLIEKKYIEKYKLYFEHKDFFDNDMNKIYVKENELLGRPTKGIDNVRITDIDNTSIGELQDSLTKYSRYTSIDESAKVKSLGSYPEK